VRIHTAFVGRGISAFPVHGALPDHHRLIRQFGVVPLMYYLYGDTVIIDDREDPHVGSIDTPANAFEFHHTVGRRMYATNKNFRFALETPMAVTGADSQGAERFIRAAADRREKTRTMASSWRFV
jgi:hypothetical protein